MYDPDEFDEIDEFEQHVSYAHAAEYQAAWHREAPERRAQVAEQLVSMVGDGDCDALAALARELKSHIDWLGGCLDKTPQDARSEELINWAYYFLEEDSRTVGPNF